MNPVPVCADEWRWDANVEAGQGDDIRPCRTAPFCGKLYQGIWRITRKYSLIIEGDAAGYSGYVPELPTILVTGHSIDELTERAKEAVPIYWEAVNTDRSPAATIREIEVELPV